MQCTRSTLSQMAKCQIPDSLIKPPARCICLHACFTLVLLLMLLWHHRKAFKDDATPPHLLSASFPHLFTLLFPTDCVLSEGWHLPAEAQGGWNGERKNSRNDGWRGRKMGGRDGAMFRALSSWSYPCQANILPFTHRVINPALPVAIATPGAIREK